MYLTIAPITLSTLILVPLALSQQGIPISVLQGEPGTCPLDHEWRDEQQDIITPLHNLLLEIAIVPQCGEGVWRRVVSLDMSDPSQQCPSPWREYTDVRSCGRPVRSSTCASVTFSTGSAQYNKVCGKAIGYQYGSPDAFRRFIPLPTGTADDNYVDGLSVTHGRNPRHHIWTFAAGLGEPKGQMGEYPSSCPCAAIEDQRFGTQPPSYVGENYFCETGANADWSYGVHYSEPLWDGEGCANSQCCSFNTPPWFSVQLPTSTTNDIEVRICADQSNADNEDVTIGMLEIYVQ